MNADWQRFLQTQGARVDTGVVTDFGDSAAERRATDGGSILADLSHLGILEFTGQDAEAFLQGQLTCDLTAIAPGAAAFGSYCSPKGRILASFLLVRHTHSFLMLHSARLTASLQRRLQMFVLRSRLSIHDAGDHWVRLGLSGPAAQAGQALLHGEGVHSGLQADGGVLVEIPTRRYLLLVPVDGAQGAWARLSTLLKPVGSGCWEWLDIREGLPLISEATQNQLVPQMANLELIGAVSFSKGCYPGQEVVARSQYLGKVKRRMFLASLDRVDCPAPGDELYCDDLPGQASGLIVNAQASPDGGYDVLAVMPASSKESSVVRLRAPDGPALRFGALPYQVE
jgi:tRNA-modifying protein YgfZ